MAEDVSPSIGYHDEFWLYDDVTAGLYKLVGVKEFDMPVGGTREQVEVTDLDATDWRRQYISAFYEDVDFEVLLNARPLSDTDVLLTAARDANDERAFKAVIAVNGSPVAQVEGTAKCTGYTFGRIAVGDVKEATATFRLVTVNSITEYVPEA